MCGIKDLHHGLDMPVMVMSGRRQVGWCGELLVNQAGCRTCLYAGSARTVDRDTLQQGGICPKPKAEWRWVEKLGHQHWLWELMFCTARPFGVPIQTRAWHQMRNVCGCVWLHYIVQRSAAGEQCLCPVLACMVSAADQVLS